MKIPFPPLLQDWLGVILPVAQVLLILLLTRLLQLLLKRLIGRAAARYDLPPELAMGVRRVLNIVLLMAATLLILERLGVSGTVLWTAFTGFATVGAVAFFAAWSVLSNIFCTFLIFIVRPFRLYETVELLENGEKPGIKGKVIDVNLLYTTLQEEAAGDGAPATSVQVPNNWFFQRGIRRWRDAQRIAGS
ncbi:mechanosensitive ion channel family protein [Pseudoxanthomonas winnipegensis]|uniref:mechanosensitive ion channel domain-containing protein n=1 Tax=Pseudoxanthomonas winnipegensis TaxID=2480810 RepID=UPI002575A11E|nr:mechanosensitive ion channel domain-containing protein [Pseudoxanthomonas winnipegensis]WJI14158.1 mechanosensitive ion channel family protein [Pseudoxanthomonas winnipegensis]